MLIKTYFFKDFPFFHHFSLSWACACQSSWSYSLLCPYDHASDTITIGRYLKKRLKSRSTNGSTSGDNQATQQLTRTASTTSVAPPPKLGQTLTNCPSVARCPENPLIDKYFFTENANYFQSFPDFWGFEKYFRLTQDGIADAKPIQIIK